MISDDEDGFYMEEVVQLDDNEIYGSKKSEKKELKLLDHSRVNYKPFRKNFYIECDEIKRMGED